MTSPGGSSMDIGDDYVAARLSIDVPQEGIEGMRELADGVERFRTAMEATARTESDMVRYLDQMTEASKRAAEAQANLTANVVAFQQANSRAVTGGPQHSSGVPVGTMQQPWQADVAGTGVARPPSPSDVYYQLQGGSNTHPHEFLNAQQVRGGVSPTDSVNLSASSIGSLAAMIAARDGAMNAQSRKTGDPQPSRHPAPHSQQTDPYAAFQNRAQGATGVAGSIMNEIAGGGAIGFGGLAVQGMNALRDHFNRKAAAKPGNANPGEEGGEGGDDGAMGLGGLMGGGLGKGLGIAGGALTAILGAAKLVQSGGAAIQGMRDIGSMRGGGAPEGFEASMKTRARSMDPYLSQEQSRQITQAEMSGGYADASDHTIGGVDDFFKNNIKNYNMSVSESADLLASTAKLTKLSVSDLAAGLGQLKEASVSGYQSLPDLVQATTANYKQLVAQGTDPRVAWNTATQNASMFSHDPVLAGTQSTPISGQMYNQMMVTPGSGMRPPPGLGPEAFQEYIDSQGPAATSEAKMTVLKRYADLAKNSSGDTNDKSSEEGKARHMTGWKRFQKLVMDAGLAPEMADGPVAQAMYEKLEWSGQSPNQIVQSNIEQHRKDTEGDRQTKSRVISTPGIAGTSSPTRTEFSNNTVDQITNAYGHDNASIEIMKDGKQVGTLDPTDKDQIDKLGSGEYQWRHKGDTGRGINLSDTPVGFGAGFSTDTPTDIGKKGSLSGLHGTGKGSTSDYNGPGSSGTMIDLTPDAKKLFQIVDPPGMPNANQVGANRGDPGASLNSPPAAAPRPR